MKISRRRVAKTQAVCFTPPALLQIASYVNKSAMDTAVLQRSLAILESMVLNSQDLYYKVAQEITIGQLIPHLQGCVERRSAAKLPSRRHLVTHLLLNSILGLIRTSKRTRSLSSTLSSLKLRRRNDR